MPAPDSPAAERGFAWKAALLAEIAAADAALKDTDIEQAVHQARVRLKRVRMLSKMAGADAIARAARALKYTLSGWRDLAALESAARDAAGGARRKGAAALTDIAARLSQAHLTLGAPAIDDLSDALERLRRDAETLPDLEPKRVRRALRRLVKDARRAWKRAQDEGGVDARHRWRRREKDRFFAASLAGDNWPAKRRTKTNDELGDTLGRERDARLLLARLESEPAPHTPTARHARRALKRHIRKLARKADRLGASLHRGGA